MGLLVGFKLRLARSTVLRRRSPGPPAPAQAGTRGAINKTAHSEEESERIQIKLPYFRTFAKKLVVPFISVNLKRLHWLRCASRAVP